VETNDRHAALKMLGWLWHRLPAYRHLPLKSRGVSEVEPRTLISVANELGNSLSALAPLKSQAAYSASGNSFKRKLFKVGIRLELTMVEATKHGHGARDLSSETVDSAR